MTGVIVSFVGNLVEDTGEVTMEGCIWASKPGAFEAGETPPTHEVTTEFDAIRGCERSEQKLQDTKRHTLQINVGSL
jgi:hypothetical protein